MKISLTGKYGQGKFAIIDDEDWDKVKDYKWRLDSNGSGYFQVATYLRENKSIFLHTLIMGVSFFHKPNKKWLVYCSGIRIGSFTSEIEAAKAYDGAASKYHGEFARLNFPGGALRA